MSGSRDHTPDQRQLELGLDDVRLEVPWPGRSPRELTRGFSLLFSRREPQKVRAQISLTDQYDLWLPTPKDGPRVVPGAVPLIPLGKRRRRRG